MAEVTIDLGSRYAAAFGLLSKNYTPRVIGTTEDKKGYQFKVYDNRNETFEDVKLNYNQKEIKFASVPFINSKDSLNVDVLAPPPLMNFTQEKALIETPINGNENIVVERWATNPFNIRIRGLLIDTENRNYPESKIRELYRLFRYNGVVDVSGTQFFDKDIASIYFKSIEINGVQGFEDTIQFLLIAKSIRPVGFTLLDPNQ